MMTTSTCLKWMRAVLLMTAMAGVGTAHAQPVVPAPNFSINWLPSLVFNLWPADFNRDGRTDLVAALGTTFPTPQGPGDLVVAIGRGDGTFQPPVALGLRAFPLNVGDMNNDGFVDVVILHEQQLRILPGRGNGTFAAPVTVAPLASWYELRVWGLTTDIDGDGNRDIFVTEPVNTFKYFRGNGNGTFQAPIELVSQAMGYQPTDATTGDFNGDGRRDVAVVSQPGIDIFLNNGNGTFAASFIAAYPLTDITTRDMNNDGRLDLIVSSGEFEFFEGYRDPGEVLIYRGNGNGTFGTPTRYTTGVNGTTSVVVGDFNGDGRPDVATSNRSAVYDGDDWFHYADSVSILPGDGAGGLLSPIPYILSYVHPGDRTDPRYPYQNQQHQLNTSDIDLNGRTDLIASPAAVLLNRPAAPNRPPSAFAGPDRTEFYYDTSVILQGEGTDPDHHWLTYTWRDDTGAVVGRLPWINVYQERNTTRTYTLTVTDPYGASASDSVTVHVPRECCESGDPFLGTYFTEPVVVGVPAPIVFSIWDGNHVITRYSVSYSLDDGRTFTAVPGCENLAPAVRQCIWQNPGPATEFGRIRLTGTGGGRDWIAISGRFAITAAPPGWTSTDIGNVGAAGTTSFSRGTWTIEGSGADIWDRADEFRFLSRQVTGTFTVTARVASIENLNRWVKAGIMVRESLAAGSRHASLLATPTTERGIAFQRRTTTGGLSTHTAGPLVAPPAWLRIGRIGDTISAYYRSSISAPWVLVGRETLAGLPDSIYVGLAVSSHVDGQLATATFDNVAIETALFEQSQDVGAVGVAGSLRYDGVVHEVRGSGADIWGTADAFHVVRAVGATLPAVDLVARVRSIENTYPWAKAGVMFREVNVHTPQAPHVMVVITPGRGVAMQYRATYGGTSVQAAVIAGMAPEWVRLTREDNRFTGYASEDGVTWRVVGTVTIDNLFTEPVLAVTSHDNTRVTTAVFENVVMRGFIGGGQ
jgi:hypothetical protein